MKKIFVVIILAFNFSCTNVSSIVEEIAKDEILESENVGITATKTEQFLKFQTLRSKASDKEVSNLLKHKNPILKSFAYQTLIERNLMQPSDAFKDAMNNNEQITTLRGDLLMTTDICTEIYFYTNNFYSNPKKREIEQMDSLILYEFDEKHILLRQALARKKYDEGYNERIITLAVDYSNTSALYYISENNIYID